MFRFLTNIVEHILYMIQGYVFLLYDIITGHRSKRSEERMRICKTCKFYHHGICKECGCILKAKTQCLFPLDDEGKSIDGCPERKW